jgi:cyclopropane fatty-acyl-phospholipid synthase-like methyltransferase
VSGLRNRRGLRIADIGCGTGASTLVLARELDAQIIAIDFLPAFLEALKERAAQAGFAERINAETASMDSLFLAAHQLSGAAKAIVAAEEREIDLYERFQAYVGYGFYIARKTSDQS